MISNSQIQQISSDEWKSNIDLVYQKYYNAWMMTTNDPTNNYITYPLGSGYGYILIPTTLPQPTGFQESNSSCSGSNIPTNNIGTLIIIDINGFSITYNIYRTFFSFVGSVDCWICN